MGARSRHSFVIHARLTRSDSDRAIVTTHFDYTLTQFSYSFVELFNGSERGGRGGVGGDCGRVSDMEISKNRKQRVVARINLWADTREPQYRGVPPSAAIASVWEPL